MIRNGWDIFDDKDDNEEIVQAWSSEQERPWTIWGYDGNHATPIPQQYDLPCNWEFVGL